MTIKAELSLSQWSLHRSLLGSGVDAIIYGCQHNPYFGIDLRRSFSSYVCGSMDPMEFPAIARNEYGINAVDYVNTFFFDRLQDKNYFAELKRRSDDEGVRNSIIMCDFEGELGAADRITRNEVVRKHIDWLMAAAILDCWAIRVNVLGVGTAEEQQGRIAEGIFELAEQADKLNMDVLIENHSDLSAKDPDWLLGILRQVNHKRAGMLIDFGSWECDPYEALEKLIPYAREISAKSYDFDKRGMETSLDYQRFFQILNKNDYQGYISIEYEGERLSEKEGIFKTKALVEKTLEKCRSNSIVDLIRQQI